VRVPLLPVGKHLLADVADARVAGRVFMVHAVVRVKFVPVVKQDLTLWTRHGIPLRKVVYYILVGVELEVVFGFGYRVYFSVE